MSYASGMRCLLIGNYGVKNIGDEALRESFGRTYPEVEWIVMTADGSGPGEVPRLPCGIRSLFRPWWRTFAAMRASDAVVFGGGSLFTDAESVWACVIWWWHAFWARLLGKPIALAFQGVGPLQSVLGRICARWVLNRCEFVSVRDPKSMERIYTIAGEGMHKKVVQSFDPVFGLFSMKNRYQSQKLIIIPRDNSTPEFFDAATKNSLSGNWTEIKILLMHPLADIASAARLSELLSSRSITTVNIGSLSQLANEVSGAGFIVTQRYHGGIAALAMGIPFVAVAQKDGDKLASLAGLDPAECSRLLKAGEEALKGFLNGVKADRK